MYVVVQHKFKNPDEVFSRGEKLIKNEGAPRGVRGLQFYPSKDHSIAVCLWEGESIADVQKYVDTMLGDAAEQTYYEIDGQWAFARQPSGLGELPAAVARAA